MRLEFQEFPSAFVDITDVQCRAVMSVLAERFLEKPLCDVSVEYPLQKSQNAFAIQRLFVIKYFLQAHEHIRGGDCPHYHRQASFLQPVENVRHGERNQALSDDVQKQEKRHSLDPEFLLICLKAF